MKTDSIDIFQKSVEKLLTRNHNILDILTKCQSCNSRVSRSIIKAATCCGCIKIIGKKTDIIDKSPAIDGEICNDCKSIIENEIGENLFYIASLCNALNISMSDVLVREIKNVEALGKYSLH